MVHQEAGVDKLPYGHPLYVVPLVFDPGDIPDVPGKAARNITWRVTGHENSVTTRQVIRDFRITGTPLPFFNVQSDPIDFRITGYGTPMTPRVLDFRVAGDPADGDIVFHW